MKPDAALSPGTDVRVTLYPLAVESPRGRAAIVQSPVGGDVGLVVTDDRGQRMRVVKVHSPDHAAFVRAIEAAL